jgi:hypothetical protein
MTKSDLLRLLGDYLANPSEVESKWYKGELNFNYTI